MIDKSKKATSKESLKDQVKSVKEGAVSSFFVLAEGSASEFDKVMHMEIFTFLRFIKHKKSLKKSKKK